MWSNLIQSEPSLSLLDPIWSYHKIWSNLIQSDPIWSYLILFEVIWSNLIQSNAFLVNFWVNPWFWNPTQYLVCRTALASIAVKKVSQKRLSRKLINTQLQPTWNKSFTKWYCFEMSLETLEWSTDVYETHDSMYFKVSIIRPSRSRLVEFEKNIVLVV